MANKSAYNSLVLILLSLGLLWLRSGWGKLTEGKFVDSLGGVLTKFASNNPFPWYKSFLQNVAIPNSKIFAYLTMWGEFLTAITVSLAALYLLVVRRRSRLVLTFLGLGLLGGVFLNAIFWLAASYTSPSTDSVNLIMFVIELAGLIFVFRELRSS